jgi:hypothetical protein
VHFNRAPPPHPASPPRGEGKEGWRDQPTYDLGIKKTKAPTPTRSMGLVCFRMARVNHLYPSDVGFIIGGMVFSPFMKIKK